MIFNIVIFYKGWDLLGQVFLLGQVLLDGFWFWVDLVIGLNFIR